MTASNRLQPDPAAYQLECAQQIVSILFKRTGLLSIIQAPPVVVVGNGNWISFSAGQSVSAQQVLQLEEISGEPVFVTDLFSRFVRARSKTNPSLHLTNLESGDNLQGHVDAYYWSRYPLRHAVEFLTRKTRTPAELLQWVVH